MKKTKIFTLVFLLFATCLANISFAANAAGTAAALPTSAVNVTTPVGYWQQYDDHTGQIESILHIYQKNGDLLATPIKAFPVNGRVPDVYCTKCTGALKSVKIIGMTVMWGMKQANTTQWSGGHIVDPKSGKVYRCKLTLINNGQQLKVRGYLGVPLLGRSQVWKRMAAPVK